MNTIFTFFICMLPIMGIAICPAFAQLQDEPQELITQPSSFAMEETVNELKSAMEEMDLNLIDEIDHAEAAAAHDLELRPTKLLIFGNPEVGTQLMQADQRAGLDLPLRVVVWQNEDGRVFLSYRSPSSLQEDFNLEAQQEVLNKMDGAMEKLSQKAIKGIEDR